MNCNHSKNPTKLPTKAAKASKEKTLICARDPWQKERCYVVWSEKSSFHAAIFMSYFRRSLYIKYLDPELQSKSDFEGL